MSQRRFYLFEVKVNKEIRNYTGSIVWKRTKNNLQKKIG